MRKFLLLGMLIGLSGVVGCGNGVANTHAERMNTYRETMDMDMRQLVDDWDMIWLADRQYRLTRWQTR